MGKQTHINLSSSDLAPITYLSGKGAVAARDQAQVTGGGGLNAKDNAVVLGAGAAVGTTDTKISANKGGSVVINTGGDDVLALSSKFSDSLNTLTAGALNQSTAQVGTLADSLRATFDKSLASVKDLATRQADAGLSDGMKFILAAGALAVLGLFVYRRKS